MKTAEEKALKAGSSNPGQRGEGDTIVLALMLPVIFSQYKKQLS